MRSEVRQSEVHLGSYQCEHAYTTTSDPLSPDKAGRDREVNGVTRVWGR